MTTLLPLEWTPKPPTNIKSQYYLFEIELGASVNTTFDAMSSCDGFDQRALSYYLNKRFPLISLLVKVSNVPGGKILRERDVYRMLSRWLMERQW